MNSWTSINIILNALTIFNSAFTAIVSIGILLIIIIFHRQTRSVPILFASQTCLAILLSAITLTSMTISSFLGFIGVDSYDDNTKWCRIRGFLIHGFLCVLYDAYGLQAIFRFFRVVFYRNKILHSFKLYCIIIPFEMIFAMICICPVLVLNDVIYLPSEFYCQTPFTNLRAILYIAVRLYGFPLIILFGIYWYLVRYIQRTGLSAEAVDARRRAQKNARDLMLIKRLLITVMLLILLGLPAIIFLMIFVFTGHLLSLAYRISWLSVSFSMVFLIIMLVKHTHPLRNTVKRLINSIKIRHPRIAPECPMQRRTGGN